MSDAEVHEIQLNGKQLVFMFMAATVVSVVIFLSGVMVGRGVRQPQADAAANTQAPVDPTVQIESPVTSQTPALDRVPVTSENLTYADRLESPSPIDETFKTPPEEKPAVKPAAVEKPAPANVVAAREKTTTAAPPPVVQKVGVTPQPAAQSAKFVEPAGKGYAVQVMAFVTLAEAESLAARLQGKGYPTFVTRTDGAAPAKYRVRVGKYDNRSDAQVIFQRLKREEHFDPWLPPR
jgi:cell division protein FtsN